MLAQMYLLGKGGLNISINRATALRQELLDANYPETEVISQMLAKVTKELKKLDEGQVDSLWACVVCGKKDSNTFKLKKCGNCDTRYCGREHQVTYPSPSPPWAQTILC